MVTSEDVVYAYRLLLDREPENADVVAHYASQVSNFRELRELFINSAEFREKLQSAMLPRPPCTPFSGPAMVVEIDASREQMAALFAKVRAQWQHLGETEPHWSVLTHEGYFQENFHMNREAFYASGERDLKMFDAALTRAGVKRDGMCCCLELGCGVGRMTTPLASRFEQVLALDISAAHLRVAQDHLKGWGNVKFRHIETIDQLSDVGHFDVLFSRIVLQHNPPPVMAHLMRHLLEQLNPGGVAYFQVPTYKAGYRFCVEEYLCQKNTTHMEMHFFPQIALFDLLAKQKCRVMEIREDDSIGISVTAVSNTLLVQKDGL